MPSEVKEPVEAERIHSMIKSGRDLDTKVVSHPIYTASVYSLNAIVDFIFHGSIIGNRQLQIVSHIELPARLAHLKAGLPAVHLGSDHFALGVKFRIADRVAGSEWTGAYYIPLVDYMENVVEVVPTDRKSYFPFEVRQKPAEEVTSPWDNEPYKVGTSKEALVP
ncbi:unnamed protein product [Mortierella alpina]